MKERAAASEYGPPGTGEGRHMRGGGGGGHDGAASAETGLSSSADAGRVSAEHGLNK